MEHAFNSCTQALHGCVRRPRLKSYFILFLPANTYSMLRRFSRVSIAAEARVVSRAGPPLHEAKARYYEDM